MKQFFGKNGIWILFITVIAAVTVGLFLKILDRLGGKTRDRLLRRGTEETK